MVSRAIATFAYHLFIPQSLGGDPTDHFAYAQVMHGRKLIERVQHHPRVIATNLESQALSGLTKTLFSSSLCQPCPHSENGSDKKHRCQYAGKKARATPLSPFSLRARMSLLAGNLFGPRTRFHLFCERLCRGQLSLLPTSVLLNRCHPGIDARVNQLRLLGQ